MCVPQERILNAFQQADVNGDGVLSRSELDELLKGLGCAMAEDEVEELLQEADVGQGGHVDFQQFINWLFHDAGVGQQVAQVPPALAELWGSLGERFGPYDMLFADDPTPAIKAALGEELFVDPEYIRLKPGPYDSVRLSQAKGVTSVWPAAGPSISHVRQVSMPNCEFMASFASLANYPKRLAEVFSNVVDGALDPHGLYTFKVIYKGRCGYLVIDDVVPGIPEYLWAAQPSQGTVWVPLLEKLTAKLSDCNYDLLKGHGGRYDAGLEFKTGMDIVSLLFGGHTICVDTPHSQDPKFCDFIEFLVREPGTILTCCTRSEGGPGLVASHAYAVGAMHTVGDVSLVQLQNPWGHGEWKGDWSDSSPLWEQHPEVAEAVGFKARNDGAFFVSRPDLLKYFTAFLFNRLTPLREAGDDAGAELDEWVGEYSDGSVTSTFRRTGEGVLHLEHGKYGPFTYQRSKHQYELSVVPPLGPATSTLFKNAEGTILGFTTGMRDFSWYVGEPAERTLAVLDAMNFHLAERPWQADEKPLHWVGDWAVKGGTADEDFITVTCEGSISDMKLTFRNGRTYGLAPVMMGDMAVTVPHDYTAIVNVNRVQRFRRHLVLNQYNDPEKTYEYVGDKYWSADDE